MKFLDWAKGKKTYLAVAAGLGVGLYQYFTGHDVPVYVNWGLMFLGLGAARSAISDQTKAAAFSAQTLFNTVLNLVEVPDPPPVTVVIPHSAVQAGETVQVTPTVSVTVGKPTPKNLSEEAVTDALNAAQIATH